MKIRLASLIDTEKIAFTHKVSIETLCKNHYAPKDIMGWTNVISPSIYESAIKENIMIVAEEQKEIIGLGIIDISNAKLCAIYIHPEYSGKGIGKKMLLKLEAIALDNKIEVLKLSSTINALEFYKHNGYFEEEKSIHELPNGIKLECINMHKKLDPAIKSRDDGQ